MRMRVFLMIPCLLALWSSSAYGWSFLLYFKLQDKNQPFLIHKIVAGEPIHYCIDGDLEKYDADRYAAVLEKSYNRWMKSTYEEIQYAGKAEEFGDLKEILTHPVAMRRMNSCSDSPQITRRVGAKALSQGSGKEGYKFSDYKEDLRLILTDETSLCSGNSACYLPKESFILFRSSRKFFDQSSDERLMLHEVGHTLGLSDQYTSRLFLSHPVFSTVDRPPSVMKESSLFSALTCDDAEGLVNLIDCGVLGNKRGGAQGWKSFCPSRQYSYVGCRPNNKEPQDVLISDDYNITVNTYNKEGRLQQSRKFYFDSSKTAPFSTFIRKEKPQEQKNGTISRPVYQKFADGLEVFLKYNYGSNFYVFVKGMDLLGLVKMEDYGGGLVTTAYLPDDGVITNYKLGKSAGKIRLEYRRGAEQYHGVLEKGKFVAVKKEFAAEQELFGASLTEVQAQEQLMQLFKHYYRGKYIYKDALATLYETQLDYFY